MCSSDLVEDIPPEYQLAFTDAKGAEFARKNDFRSIDFARRLEENPDSELAKAKIENDYKLNHCTPQSRNYHLEWQEILVTKSVAEIVGLLRGTDEETEPLRRMFPGGVLSKEEIQDRRRMFKESEIKNGFRKQKMP